MADSDYSPSESYNDELERWFVESLKGPNEYSLGIFDPFFSFFDRKDRINKVLYIFLQICFFGVIALFGWLSLISKEQSFIQALSIKICCGVFIFYLAHLVAIGIKIFKSMFTIFLIIISIELVVGSYYARNILKDYFLELAVGILLLIMLDHLFKTLLRKVKPIKAHN